MITNVRRFSVPLALAVLAAVASGCSSAAARFYTLQSTATPGGAPPVHDAVLVGPVTVPSAVDRPQFVVLVEANRVEIDEFNVWAAPVDEGIARVVAADLSVMLGSRDVAIAPLPNFRADWRVAIDVQRFDSVPVSSVTIDAVWSVMPTATGKKARTGRTLAEEPVQGEGYAAIAAAHSRALAKMSGEIAAAIRSASGSH